MAHRDDGDRYSHNGVAIIQGRRAPPENLFDVIKPQLRRGEKAVWAERPGPGARAWSRLFIFLFGIPFFGFAVFWTTTAAQMGGGFFPLFGLPFLVVGLCLLLSPLWSYIEAKNWLVYGITDQRLLIIRTWPRQKVESFEPSDITKLARTSKSDGSGNIIFAEELRQGRSNQYRVPRGFYGVPEVMRVEEEILKLRNAATET